MNKPKFSFVIDRKEWLRGGMEESMLYRPLDKRLCCVGICLREAGLPIGALRNKITADGLAKSRIPAAKRLFGDNLEALAQLYAANDRPMYDRESEREEAIRGHFEQFGIRVSFKGRS